MHKPTALAFLAVALGVVALVAFQWKGDGGSAPSAATVENEHRDLHTYIDPYVALVEEATSSEVVPQGFKEQVGPLRADFDLGVETWMRAHTRWELPGEPSDGLPDNVTVVDFNNDLVEWGDLQDDLVALLAACEGKQLHRCEAESDVQGVVQQSRDLLGDLRESEEALLAELG